MAPRAKGKRRTSSLKVRAKRDPIGTAKTEVNKTGLLKFPIGAYVLGAMGGAGTAVALTRIPVVGNLLAVFAKKGANLTSGFNK